MPEVSTTPADWLPTPAEVAVGQRLSGLRQPIMPQEPAFALSVSAEVVPEGHMETWKKTLS